MAMIPSLGGLLARYAGILAASWRLRRDLAPPARGNLERQFLPAALELQETPPSPLPRAVLWTVVAAFAAALVWSCIGSIDVVAVATGRIVPGTRLQVVQPLETAAVVRIHVRDGQRVAAGDPLIDLDATAAGAEVAQARESWAGERLREARCQALIATVEERGEAPLAPVAEVPSARWASEAILLARQREEYRRHFEALAGEQAQAEAERAAAQELEGKLLATLPIARMREDDYQGLLAASTVSRHGYLEKQQARIEMERDLAYQRARIAELGQAIEGARARLASWRAEFLRTATAELVEAGQKAAALAAEVGKGANRAGRLRLTAPVAGVVQQLAVHTEGGVVTSAQPLLAIVPEGGPVEVEAVLENQDVGFVAAGQAAAVKVEAFPFTRYGTIPARVDFVSADAVEDERRGLVFPVRLRLERGHLEAAGRTIAVGPGLAVTAEISTGRRRLIEYFLSPIAKTVDESLGER